MRQFWAGAVRNPAYWIFWGLLAIYHADGRAHPEVDCVPAPFAAWSLVHTGSLDVGHYEGLKPYHSAACLRTLSDGRVVPQRSPGSAIAVLPLIAPVALIRDDPPSNGTMDVLGKSAGAIHVAAAGAIFFLICRRLAPAGAWPATVLFGLGTCLYSVAAQAIWVHGPATFWLTLALYLMVRAERATWMLPFLAGLCLGMAVLCRPTAALFPLASGAAWLLTRDRRVVPLTLGGSIPVAYLLALNWYQFGSPLVGGYGAEAGIAPPPFWLAFTGLLVAPSRGLFVYSPALLLIPMGIWGIRRPHRALLLCWTAAAAATVVLFARWHDWRGGWCYGPRFLCEALPILALLFAIAYDRVTARSFRIAAWALVALSVSLHFLGIYGGREYEAWQCRHDPANRPDDPHGRCLFELHDTQIGAHANGLLRKLKDP